jgi:hypothetical protein
MMPPSTEVVGPIIAETGGTDLVPSPSLEQAREFARQSKAESTLRGYRSDWRIFASRVIRTTWPRCPRLRTWWRPTLPNAPDG